MGICHPRGRPSFGNVGFWCAGRALVVVCDRWVNRVGLAIDAMTHFDLGDGLVLD